MFVTFFHALKRAGLPVTLKEYLTLLEGLDAGVTGREVEEFYFLSRACLVKDERNLDRFDRVFGEVFKGIATLPEAIEAEIPEEWLRLVSALHLSEEDKARIEELGGWEKIMETLRQRLAEQKERHAGGNKWIGTGGTSPFGAYGYNPAGVRIGQNESRHRRAIKVWDKREFKDLDDAVEIGTRNIKVALRRLRSFARTGAADELDLAGTIRGTAEKGYLDIRMVPERHNTVKVLMFFDVGGSMDWHIKGAEELFSAAARSSSTSSTTTSTIASMRKSGSTTRGGGASWSPTWDVLHTYPSDYKVIFVGDAAMSPYELTHIGGAVEHMNPEPGALWLRRVTQTYKHCVWLNPVAERHWGYTPSISMIRDVMEGRMYPLTLGGLDQAMVELMR